MNILHVTSSNRPAEGDKGSQSTRLSSELVAKLACTSAHAQVTRRDLAIECPPVLDAAAMLALSTPSHSRNKAQACRIAIDDALIAELMAADIVVIAAPMYNFTVPAPLKIWFDAIARAGTTFRYVAGESVGLLRGKKAYAVITSGGMHHERPTDLITPYVRLMLGFVGIDDVDFIHAEGMNLGADARTRALARARDRIGALAARAGQNGTVALT